ncbi:MAG: Tn3 family transposase, partial [Alphaproteobacteria bacterium]|nr:Tn3 family transposase [Alphaproteobacteria bacterium]
PPLPCSDPLKIRRHQLAGAIQLLRARGEAISNALLPYLAPLDWRHINLTGDYIWSEPQPGHPRPARWAGRSRA